MVHEVDGKRKQGQPRTKWRKQVEGNMKKICLKKEDATDWCRWRDVGRVVEVVGCIWLLPFTGD